MKAYKKAEITVMNLQQKDIITESPGSIQQNTSKDIFGELESKTSVDGQLS